MADYQVIVIGAGPGGYLAAEFAAKNGLKTLCVEREDYGGICLNKGCIPTKTLLRSSKIYQTVLKASEYGIDNINTSAIVLNWEKILARKDKVVKSLQMGVLGLLKGAKADTIKGDATFVDDHTISVNGKNYTFDNLILATGSFPKRFNFGNFPTGYKNGVVITSDEALNLPKIPKSLVVIGGGVIGVEFATLYSSLGTKVTLLQGVDRILEVMDSDVSSEVTKLLAKNGVEIITNAKVIDYSPNKIVYEVANTQKTVECDYCLVSVGRVANSELAKNFGLNINQFGSIETNDKMQTSKPHIYAIGDCTSKIMLAHSAYHNALLAVNTILNKSFDYNLWKIPSCIYTSPEVASIGYNESELKEKNIQYVKGSFPYAHLGKALGDGNTTGFIKLMVEPKNGTILGCQIVGDNASNLISEIALAVQSESTIHTLINTIHPHPTIGEIIFEVAMKIYLEHFAKK